MMTSRLIALLLALIVWSAGAQAAPANCPGGASPPVDGVCAVTLGTSAATLLNAYQSEGGGSTGYRLIIIDNESATASIAVCFGATCTPALNTAGSFTLAPATTRIWSIPYGSGGGFNDPMRGIASAVTTPVTTQAQ